jgi:hypothetical protein
MKGIALSLLFVITIESYSQKRIYCENLKISPVYASVIINGKTQKKQIAKQDILLHDLQIILSDTSYTIVGFVASYDCHSRSLLFDLTERTYFGDKIKANDNFIKHIWTDDSLVLGCINIEKNGKLFLIPGLLFRITD